MSTNRSVDRFAVAREKGRSAATKEKVRSTATNAGVRSTSKSKKDRSPNLCAFTFADGRQCRTPRCSGHLHFCYFHAQKEAERLAAQQVGQDISRFLPTKLLTACDLGVAMSRLFCAVAQGQVKPKVASTLAYLAQTMLQSIPIAQHEYCESFDPDIWRSTVRSSFNHDDPDDADDTADDAADAPASAPTSHQPAARREESAPPSNASLTTQHSPLPPAPSPHTPLPPTSAEFAQLLLAGRNSSRPKGPTPSGSEIPALSGLELPTPATQPAPSSLCTLPTLNNSQPTPTPPTPQPTSPQQSQPTHNSPQNSLPTTVPSAPPPVPPGFGAPANWDVLIPPKPRRRFSRHWHLPE